MAPYSRILTRLAAANVRFIVVGGVAVVLHGYARMTVDLDLIIDLEPVEALKCVEVLESLSLVPGLPVNARDFADPTIRQKWIDERSLMLFSMHDPNDPFMVVDLFAELPDSFERLWSDSSTVLVNDHPIRIASVQDLVAMKRAAGRHKDLDDIEKLLEIEQEDSR